MWLFNLFKSPQLQLYWNNQLRKRDNLKLMLKLVTLKCILVRTAICSIDLRPSSLITQNHTLNSYTTALIVQWFVLMLHGSNDILWYIQARNHFNVIYVIRRLHLSITWNCIAGRILGKNHLSVRLVGSNSLKESTLICIKSTIRKPTG